MIKSKRGVNLPQEKGIYWLLLLIVGAIVIGAFLIPGGLLDRLTKEGEGSLVDKIPGKEPLESKPEYVIPEDLKADFKEFCNILRKQNDSEKCLIRYPTFSTLKKFKIKIRETENNLYAQLLNQNGSVVDSCFVKNLTPCIIAGQEREPQRFYFNHLWQPKGIFFAWADKPPKCRPNCFPEFSEPTTITIEWEGTDYDEKSISATFDDGWKIKQDMEDADLFYKPDKNHVCFFPTHDGDFGCSWNKEGLDDDCFLDKDEYIRNHVPVCPVI